VPGIDQGAARITGRVMDGAGQSTRFNNRFLRLGGQRRRDVTGGQSLFDKAATGCEIEPEI
jgi:hypothetical protein